MLTRIPKLVPDSPWEAKGIAIIKSITDNKVFMKHYSSSLPLMVIFLFLDTYRRLYRTAKGGTQSLERGY